MCIYLCDIYPLKNIDVVAPISPRERKIFVNEALAEFTKIREGEIGMQKVRRW